jgi:uncharacterized protein (TIGR03000 family)
MCKRWFPAAASAALALVLLDAGTSSAAIFFWGGGFGYPRYGYGYGYPGYGYPYAFYPSYGYSPYSYGTASGYSPYYGTMGYGYNYVAPTTTYSGYYSPTLWAYSPNYGRPAGSSSAASGVAPAGYVSYYPPAYATTPAASASTAPGTNERPAWVEVTVPAGAELWFDGQKTTKTGERRVFRTPPLEKGHNYYYDVKARWTEGGKPVERDRRVRVHADERVAVDFVTSKP